MKHRMDLKAISDEYKKLCFSGEDKSRRKELGAILGRYPYHFETIFRSPVRVDRCVYDRCYWPMLILFRMELYVDSPAERRRKDRVFITWMAPEVTKWTVEDVKECLSLFEPIAGFWEFVRVMENKALDDPEHIGLRWGYGHDDLMEMFDMRRQL